MLPAPWRIEKVRKETADTFTLALTPMNDTPPFAFAAGQFNMLYVFGVGEVPISISGNPLEPSPLIHTTRVVGVVTRALAKLKMGDVLGVRGPYGSGWPLDAGDGRDLVIVAGGIGLAPLRSVIYECSRIGKILAKLFFCSARARRGTFRLTPSCDAGARGATCRCRSRSIMSSVRGAAMSAS